jgi:hypothetical protein
MKYPILLISFVFCLISCNKKNVDLTNNVPDPQTSISSISDSCCYTIDGMQFICDKPNSDGRGNAHASFDITINNWDTDTLQYRTMFGFYKASNPSAQNDGGLIIHFVKKYPKNLLIKPILGIMAPVTDTPLYVKGIRNYAVDFDRFNSQNGIALEVINRTGTSSEILLTYIYVSPFSATKLNNDCQNNSQFEILNVYKGPDGRRIIEAKFTANLFDKYEKLKRLENGYMRFHIE